MVLQWCVRKPLSMECKLNLEVCGLLFALEYMEMLFPMEYGVHEPFVRRLRAYWGSMVDGPVQWNNEVTSSDYNVKPKSRISGV